MSLIIGGGDQWPPWPPRFLLHCVAETFLESVDLMKMLKDVFATIHVWPEKDMYFQNTSLLFDLATSPSPGYPRRL